MVTKNRRFPLTLAAIEEREKTLDKADKDQWKIGEALLEETPKGKTGSSNGRDEILKECAEEAKSEGYEGYDASTLKQIRETTAAFPEKERIYKGLGFWAYYKARSPATLKIIAAKAKKEGAKLGRPFIEKTMKELKGVDEAHAKAKVEKELLELEQERKAAESELFTAQSRLRFAQTDEEKLAAQQEIEKAETALEEVREKVIEISPQSMFTDEDKIPVGDNAQAAILSGMVNTMDMMIAAGEGAYFAEKFGKQLTPELLADLHPDLRAGLLYRAQKAVEAWTQIVEVLGGKKATTKKQATPALKIVGEE